MDVENTRIQYFKKLIKPDELKTKIPINENTQNFVQNSRNILLKHVVILRQKKLKNL